MGLIHDDVVPSPRGRRSLRPLSAALVVALVLAVAVAGLTSMMRPEADPEPEPALEEPALDRAEEVLGEVFTRPDDDDEVPEDEVPPITAPPTTTQLAPASTTTTTTTTTRASTTTTSTTVRERPTNAPPPLDLAVSAEGVVVIEQFFSPQIEKEYEPNPDCGSLHEVYEVVVYDDRGDKIAVAELTGGTYEREEEQWGGTTTRCTYDYRVTVPEADTYTFTVAESWDHESVHDSEAVSEEELRSDGAPTLTVSHRYCPEC